MWNWNKEKEIRWNSWWNSCVSSANWNCSMQLSHSSNDKDCQTIHLAPGRRCKSGNSSFLEACMCFRAILCTMSKIFLWIQLKMWISFLIPKIEDGNNFGVSIQEDMLAEIRTVESEAAAFFDQISRYFITRGKIVTKVSFYLFNNKLETQNLLRVFCLGNQIPTRRRFQSNSRRTWRERIR